MSNELDQILTSEGQPDFAYKLGQLRGSILHGATFDPNEDEFKVVSKIIWEVLEHRDQALRKCTQEYDHVDIKPEEFQIPKEDLEKAHSEIDQELLKSLRQAIENVRKYQKEILHSGKNHPGITYKLIEPYLCSRCFGTAALHSDNDGGAGASCRCEANRRSVTAEI